MIEQLWRHLSKLRRRQFFLVLMLMILASLAEIVSIGAVVPFLGALTAPEQIYQHQLAQPLIQILKITDSNQLLFPLTIMFILATLIASALRLLLLYVSTRLSYATGADLSINIYRRTLYQDYAVHISRNSSDIINSIITKTNTVIGSVLGSLLNLISSTFIMIGVIAVMFTINAKVAFITFSIFMLLYGVIAFFTKKYLQKNSQLIADQSTKMVKSLQEGLGGIRDVLIDGTQEFFCKIYQNADLSLRRASGDNVFIASSPRYLMEAIGMILIAIVAYVFTLQEGDILTVIPILGAFAIGAQKLLPAFQQAYGSYSAIKGARASFFDVLNLLNQPLPEVVDQSSSKLMRFEKDIVFKGMSFRYTKDTPWILKDINLSFKKGQKVGFIGETGSGKSTLLDILMGLLSPSLGELQIDGVTITRDNKMAWQSHISHVPQSIYLSDSVVQENIAFGVEPEKIEEDKVILVAQQAHIEEVINNLKNKYKTVIGERGAQLSGGQRQRIGIARALYKDSDVIIFDEATSSLDNQTEKKIMQKISSLKNNKTIFIIAHKLETLKKCDFIIRINKDHTIEKLSYHQINLD